VATALTLQGAPYRDGGSDPSRGFDCSGLVQWVFARHGTALPRQTSQQFTVGQRVDPVDIRAGDLVFFSTVSRGASHVGIALGDGRFLHAPSSRGVVRVERYEDSPYWSRRFVGARRVASPAPVVATSDLAAATQAD
jgi:cell wall-associated NlpC family hydrolase